ncbi:MAG: zinc ribbon domain-containing protein [Oscillospiraceae bacterium]|nr:zinc ribbon domain-containing protein [Oscillospiraceae bacterium]
MKFCPHCGETLTLSSAPFCSDCGKSLDKPAERKPPHPAQAVGKQPGGNPQKQAPPKKSSSPVRTVNNKNISQKTRTHQSKPPKRKNKPPAGSKPDKQETRASEHPPRPKPMDENYDGYYDDVPTADNGHAKERFDSELIRRIGLVAAGALAIVILSVVAMYLL